MKKTSSFSRVCCLLFAFGACSVTALESLAHGVDEGDEATLLQIARMAQEAPIDHSHAHDFDPNHQVWIQNEAPNIPRSLMQERLKALEVFGPLYKRLEYKANKKSWISELSDVFTGCFARSRGNRIQIFWDLYRAAQEFPSGIRSIATELRRILYAHEPEDREFNYDPEFENLIITALESLQQENLKVSERLWILDVLQNIQSLLPKGKLNQLRQDPKTGKVSRGGLELFLVGGLDCKIRLEGISSSTTAIMHEDTAVKEALQRVELIVKIRNLIHNSERNHQRPTVTFIRIHDQLLQHRILSSGIVEWLALEAMHHVIVESTPYAEIECLCHILQHLDSFYPVTKKLGITEVLDQFEHIVRIKEPKMMKTYKKSRSTKSLADAMIVKSLTLECIQHMKFETTPDKEIQDAYEILKHLESLYPVEEIFPITEPLKRVELILHIRKYLHGKLWTHQTPTMMKIHDTLLQTSSLANMSVVKSLASQCMQHMIHKAWPDEETRCFYNILEHLKTFNPISKKRVESWKSNSKPFVKIKTQAELQTRVHGYLDKKHTDPYIAGLLLPFVGKDPVELDYLTSCLHSLNIQETAMKQNKARLYGMNDAEGMMYHESQDFFIDTMIKAIPLIRGLQQYLDTHVKKDGEILHPDHQCGIDGREYKHC